MRLPDHLSDVVTAVHRTLVDRDNGSVTAVIDRRDIEACARATAPLGTDGDIEAVADAVERQLHGFGPLDPLLSDPAVTEIMVNGAGPVWVERAGRLTATHVVLDSAAVRLVIDRIVGPLGLRLDRVVPSVDARLDDGSRVHIAVPPMTVDGPHVTIRRFPETLFPLAAFARPEVVELLEQAVGDRANIVVSGSTGSGKTSLVNALATVIPEDERIITIEDAAELRLPGDHVVRMEARPPNAEGVGEITVRSLVRNALRMRPDRLVVGEVRGAEALEMIQALSTGHAGSLSTCHANGPLDALDRLVAMALMSEVGAPADLVRTQLTAAVDVVVHVAREADGRRSVVEVMTLEERTPRHVVRGGVVRGGPLERGAGRG